jgi:hypothetical protein
MTRSAGLVQGERRPGGRAGDVLARPGGTAGIRGPRAA